MDNRLMQLSARVVSFSLNHFGEVRASLDIGQAENGRPLFRVRYDKRVNSNFALLGVSMVFEKGIGMEEHKLTTIALRDLFYHYALEMDGAEIFFKSGRYYLARNGSEGLFRERDYLCGKELRRDLQELVNDYVRNRVREDFKDYKEPF